MNWTQLKLMIETFIFALVLASCNPTKGELEDTTGYTPVKACIERVVSYKAMIKTMVSVTVSYINYSSKIDTAIVSLGREPVSLFHKGDTLQFYIHPEYPKELRFKKDQLFLPAGSPVKPYKKAILCPRDIR